MQTITEDWKVIKLGDENYFEILPSGIKPFVDKKEYLSTNSIQGWKIVQPECLIDFKNRPSRANMQPVLNSVWFAKMINTVKVYSFTLRNKDEIQRYILSTGFCGILCKEKKVLPEYLGFVFLTQFFNSAKNSLCYGVTQKAINNENVKSITIPVPPFHEQQKIAIVLSKIQQAIERQDKIIKATKNLKKSLMHKLFTEGIGHTEFKDSEIGQIPKSWKIKKLEEISDFKNGVNFTKNQKGNKGILTIDVLNMYGEGLYVNLDNLYRINKEIDKDYLLRNGDILFVRSSLKREGVGWATLYKEKKEPVTFCGFIIRSRLKSNDILPEFVAYFLRTNIARQKLVASSGKVAITNINQGMLGKVEIPIPSLEEQKEIVNILQYIDRKIESEQNRQSALQQLFKTMLSKLITGEIRVKDLDLGDYHEN